MHVHARVLLVQIWIQNLLEVGVFNTLAVVLPGYALVEDVATVGDRSGNCRRFVEGQRARQPLYPILCGLQLNVVSVLARQEVAEGGQLWLLLVDRLADDGFALGVEVRLRILHEPVVHHDLREILVLDQLHHISYMLLAEFVHVLVVLESIQNGQSQLQGSACEDDVDAADLQCHP